MSKYSKKDEELLKELLDVMPTLRKAKMHGEVETKIKTLRTGRKSKSYVLELSRKFRGQDLKVSAPLPKFTSKSVAEGRKTKMDILKELKAAIIKQVKEIKFKELPPIEDYTFPQGVTVRKLAEVYLDAGTFLKVQERKVRQDMTRAKKPNGNENHIGIEIEFLSKNHREFICDRLFEAGMGKYVHIHDDGSLRAEGEFKFAHEMNILVKQSEYHKVVNKICEVLNGKCGVNVNLTCGLHVHIDMRNRDVNKCFHNLVSMQQFLYAMLPAARRSSKYSYPVKGTKIQKRERYHGVNAEAFAKYQTLELRMHCGTTQGKKINNWIALLLAMCDAPQTTFVPVSLADLQECITIDKPLLDYVTARIAKFAAQHKSTVPTAEEPGTMPELEALMGEIPYDDSPMERSEMIA